MARRSPETSPRKERRGHVPPWLLRIRTARKRAARASRAGTAPPPVRDSRRGARCVFDTAPPPTAPWQGRWSTATGPRVRRASRLVFPWGKLTRKFSGRYQPARAAPHVLLTRAVHYMSSCTNKMVLELHELICHTLAASRPNAGKRTLTPSTRVLHTQSGQARRKTCMCYRPAEAARSRRAHTEDCLGLHAARVSD